MNLEDQLKRLVPPDKKNRKRKKESFETIIRKYSFPISLGKYRLDSAFTLKEIPKITIRENITIHNNDILFFDTETTGLSSGTGTIPFLVGFGYFLENGFVTKQFFLESPSREYAMLEKIEALINRFPYIVSYNGKGFDTHILETRFVLNRMKTSLTNKPHIDLLYPCRASFRRYLGSATLQDIERGIFDYTRGDDILGALIPYVYFAFLKNGDRGKINTVIEHNSRDIVSLAFIIKMLDELLGDPTKSPHDIVSISTANYLKNKGINDKAKSHFESIIKATDEIPLLKEAKKNLSMLLKKENIEKASLMWEEEKNELYAIVELAKYHEHRTKRIDKALNITRKGLAKCDLMIELGGKNVRKMYSDLKKRKERLERKLERKPKP